MDHSSSSERLVEALGRVLQHWETRPKAEAGRLGGSRRSSRPFTIALSREAGARGTATAREVGARLAWLVYDHELLERIAQEMKLRSSLLASVDEKRVSWLQECVEAFASVAAVSGAAYVRRLSETLLSLAAHGECVIVGRGAAQVLPAETTLRVRLVAPVAWRVEAVAGKFGVAREDAARRVETTDRERVRFVKDHFHKDPIEPTQYDLILNASRFSVGACADLIVEALHRLQAHGPVGPGGAVAHLQAGSPKGAYHHGRPH
jgi:cytidylate kinase